MEKATEVSTLLREKEKRISQLEQPLEAEKEIVTREAVEQLAKLQKDMEVLKIIHEANILTKKFNFEKSSNPWKYTRMSH